jgi:hypothetical protein
LDIEEYRVLFLTVTFVSALLVASPVLSRLLVFPRTEFFTELWILGPNRRAEDYPFNISSGQDYSVYLGVGNRLGYCAYYLVRVKFRNQTQPSPTSFGPIENRSPSSLPSLYNIAVFVGDEQVWELPLTFSLNYAYDESLSRMCLQSLKLNDVTLNVPDLVIEWDSTRKGFYGFLFFELWLFNGLNESFQYHGRFVGLWLNMTTLF